MGLEVRRSSDAYASTPGNGVLLLADATHLDPDDSLAQMILHEICHWLIQGETAFAERDWGLDNESERDVPREHACLRLQADLTSMFGLRRVLAPTTDFRAFYDALPEDPFMPRTDPTTAMAMLGRRRADMTPWGPHLFDALRATQAIVEQAQKFAPAGATAEGTPDLWTLVEPAPAPHPSGLPPSALRAVERTCGTCVWRHGTTHRCRQARDSKVRVEWPGCERWEAALDCRACGACCRAAYDCVQVSRRDPVRKKHPELVVLRGPYLEIVRSGDRCSALVGGPPAADAAAPFEPYTCRIYDDRPKTCRDFTNGGEHCLTARRRVGLSL
jgi:hypothetical protein